MSLFGRNDQSVTANSTTTAESTTGAPIGTYALVKGSGNGTSPISMDSNAHFGNTSPGSRASVDVNMFNNTTPGAFTTNQAVGIFGVSAKEMSNNIANASKERPAHAGWVVRRAGTGPVTSITYTGTATGYSNTDVITVSSLQPGGNATATVSTNSTGGALVITITNPGSGFTSISMNSSNVSIAAANGASSNGSGATFTATAGGRAGRVMTETLVAFGSLGAQTAAYGTAASVADSTDDNTYYPGT